MISWKIDIIAALRGAGYNTTKIRREHIIGEQMLTRIRSGKLCSWAVLNTICGILDCQPGDLVEFTRENVGSEESASLSDEQSGSELI